MINKDFYPTPARVVEKMLSEIPNYEQRWILEPSAGKGDILDYLTGSRYGRRDHNNIAAIEIDPELQATLKGKGYRVVASDFLSFTPSNYFDLIIMNPPFSNGADHLLHAWKILHSGDIVCLLNAETILSPFSEKRKLLLNLIEQHGSYEIIGDVFRDAERSTGVNTALVRLHKDGDMSMFEFREETSERVNNISGEPVFELTSPDRIQDIVDRYEAAKASFADLWKAHCRVLSYITGIHDAEKILEGALDQEAPIYGYNHFVTNIRTQFWNKVFGMTDFSSRMTTRVKDEFDKFCAQNNGMEFTVENIQGLLGDLIMSTGKITEQCIIDVFDQFTKYHEKNRVHIEGWKTNSQWQANRRIILPYVVSRWMTGGSFHVDYRREREMDDIDKAMCVLAGKSFQKIRTIGQTIKAGDQSKQGVSEFFELRWYDKGTLHLFFRDEALWKRFNIAACKGKNWLPGEAA